MNLRTKVFLLISVIMAGFFSVTLFFIEHNLTQSFVELEKQEAEKNLNRVKDALNEKIKNLEMKLTDWAQWDDSYQFVLDRNEEYVTSNLQNNAFDILHINFVLYLDEKKEIFFKKFIIDGQEKEFPEEIVRHFEKDIEHNEITLSATHSEISSIDSGKMIYSAQPITTSDGLSSPNGIIIFGFLFDKNNVAEIAQLTHLQVSFAPYQSDKEDGFSLARSMLSHENVFFIPDSKDKNVFSSYTVVMNADDHPTIIFRVDALRDIYQKGQSSIFLFTMIFVISGILFCGGILYLLGHFVLNKVLYLHTAMHNIRQNSKMKQKIELPGKDELSLLAQEMDKTFESLEQKEENLRV